MATSKPEQSYLDASVRFTELAIRTQYQDLSLNVQYVQPLATVKYVELALNVRVDMKGLFPRFNEPQYTAEIFSVSIEKRFIEIVPTTDWLNKLEVTKVLKEDANTLDTQLYTFNKSLRDIADLNESISVNYQKHLFDSVGVQDDIIANISDGMMQNDSASVSDFKDVSFTKTLKDTASFSEALRSNFQKALLDQTYIGDFTSVVFGTGFSHSVNQTDQIVKQLTKGLTDSLTMTDSGTIYIQSYSPFYFAEDYVGTYYNY